MCNRPFWSGLGGQLFAIGDFEALVLFSVYNVNKIVSGDGERAGNGYVRRAMFLK